MAFVSIVGGACQRDSPENANRAFADYPLLAANDENLTHVATLRADSGEHVLGEMFMVSEWQEGYVAPSADRSKLLFFDASGTLRKVSGSSGSGPGEWQQIGMLIPEPEGELLVLERPRYNRLDKQLQWVDSFLGATLDCQQFLSDGTLMCVTNTGIGPAWFRLARSGDTVAAGGPRRLAVGTPCEFCEAAVLHEETPGDSTTLASIGYRLVSRIGASLQEVRPLVFPLPEQGALYEAARVSKDSSELDFALPDRVMAFGGWRLRGGDVAIVFSAPAAGTAGMRAPPVRGGATRAGRSTLEAMKRFSTVVLTIDSVGRPVSHMEFTGERVLPIGPSLLARARYDSTGLVEVQILRASSRSNNLVSTRHGIRP